MSKLPVEIIYEDKRLVVINKPAGMVVNRAESVTGETVQDYIATRYQIPDSSSEKDDHKTQIFKQRSGIAHRLDKETSGCLLIAKDPEILTILMKQFKTRQVHKTYLALVHGKVDPREGWWYWPVGRKEGGKRDEFGVRADGRLAQTNYKVIRFIGQFTLLECKPITGRTHQIRVHTAFAGYPIISDQKYSNKKAYKQDIKWCPRHFLHASSIEFIHPDTNAYYKFKAELPNDLGIALKNCPVEI